MDQDADAELADHSAHEGQPVRASSVEHADVTVLTLRAEIDPPAIASNGVAVEIQADVVSADLGPGNHRLG
jgi:hypothetical protein